MYNNNFRDFLIQTWNDKNSHARLQVWGDMQERFGNGLFNEALYDLHIMPSAQAADDLACQIWDTTDSHKKAQLKQRLKSTIKNGQVFINLPVNLDDWQEASKPDMLHVYDHLTDLSIQALS